MCKKKYVATYPDAPDAGTVTQNNLNTELRNAFCSRMYSFLQLLYFR